MHDNRAFRANSSKQEALNQCWFNVAPHPHLKRWPNNKPTPRVKTYALQSNNGSLSPADMMHFMQNHENVGSNWANDLDVGPPLGHHHSDVYDSHLDLSDF